MPFAFTDIEMVFNEDRHAVDWIFRYGNEALAELEKLPLEQLSDILDKLPENGSGVPTGKLPEEKKNEEKDKAAALTDEEKDMARKMNLTDEEFLAVKKANQEEEE